MVLTIISLLQSEAATKMTISYQRDTMMEEGKKVRAFCHFSSGEYVRRTEELKKGGRIPHDAIILYLSCYIDSTPTGKNMKDTAKPLSVTLLNFFKDDLAQPKNRQVYGNC
jgi:predicted dithiol-disulfide oxidoreductase (DUF899 family)